VVARIQRDKKFARALYAEALNALPEGETEEGLARHYFGNSLPHGFIERSNCPTPKRPDNLPFARKLR